MIPVLGDPRIDHAIPATSGGINSGMMLTASIVRRNGVFVRAVTQEKNNPKKTASTVPPKHTTHVLRNALITLGRSEEHTSELQSLMRILYAVFCLKQNISSGSSTLTTSE